VTEAALELIDEHGSDQLTLAKVAEHTGVAAPSLYKHVRNLAELRDRVAIRVVGELTERLTAAVMGRGGDEALRAAMWAYRQYVIEHPNRYAAFPQAPVRIRSWQRPRAACSTWSWPSCAATAWTGRPPSTPRGASGRSPTASRPCRQLAPSAYRKTSTPPTTS
jgi:AcrR family transcriptional regulator